jgi:hypothetical protein
LTWSQVVILRVGFGYAQDVEFFPGGYWVSPAKETKNLALIPGVPWGAKPDLK